MHLGCTNGCIISDEKNKQTTKNHEQGRKKKRSKE
jgi:hypothetical protein